MSARSVIVYPCRDLSATVGFFTELGFVVDSVMPADDPVVIEMFGFGMSLRLDRSASGGPPTVVLVGADTATEPNEKTAPDGGVVRIESGRSPIACPPLAPAVVVSHLDGPEGFGTGRAGMEYRDLIPDRQGGRFIASHIRIPVGGPVPDSVHYHRIRFQMLYVARGWVKVVYEDQGEPFVMHPGDAVLQAPEIRHRVLESSDGFEIIEIGDPAEHQTLMDHSLELPTEALAPNRMFGGQRFHRHVAANRVWADSAPGWQTCDLGIADASNGMGSAVVHRVVDRGQCRAPTNHDHDLHFTFVLDGEATVTIDDRAYEVRTGSAVTVPAGTSYDWADTSADLVLLQVTV